jgi:hypothetical protein
MNVELPIALVALALICATEPSLAQSFSPEDLARRTVERRAVEAAIWGMPAVNTELMLQEMLTKTNGKVNQIVYWGHPLDWHNQTLTPNPDAIYFMAFFNTKDVGPVVIDVPPGVPKAHSTAILSLSGRRRSKTLAFWGSTRGRAANF